jgi:predicted ATPase
VLYPVIDQLERGLRFAKDDTEAQKLDKLETVLTDLGLQTSEYVPVLALLLSLTTDDRYPVLQLSPQQRKKKTLEAIVIIVKAMSSQQPLLMVVEDAQWIDPSTMELISLLIEQLSSARFLLLITCRPEFDAPWGSQMYVTALTLNRLNRQESAGMVAEVTRGKSLPPEVFEQIITKSDGVPLFVEEVTKNLLESGLLEEAGDHYALSGPLPELAIPVSIHDSLMARLDRLGRVKEVAQLGATMGRTFSHELLAAVSPVAERELQDALAQLIQAELLYRRGLPPDVTYEFKHALVRDAAYESLLKSARHQYHQQIARVLEEKFPQTAETEPEILAQHYAEADLAEKAIHYWHRAGQRAMARSASKEAHAHFTHGLEVLGTLPNTTERKIQEIALQNALAGAVINVAGLASTDLERAYLRARDLCEQIGDHKQRFVVEWGLWHIHIGRGKFHRSRRLADQLLNKARHQEDPEILLEAYHADWSVLNLTGEANAARECCEQGWDLYDREAHGAHAFTFGGHDPGVCSRNMGAWALWQLGYPEQALTCYEQGLALAKDLGHPQIVAHAYNWGMPLHQFCGDREKVQELAEVALELTSEQALANYYTDAIILKGWLLAEDGQPKDAIPLMTKALAERQTRGTMFLQPYYMGLLAQAYVRADDIAEALRLLTDAIERVHNTGEGWIEADLHNMKGDLLLASGKQDKAEACLRKTLQIASAQNVKSYELRAATSLARLFAEQGKHAQAHELLAPVYDWFTEGFDTADLKEAKALLDELA